ncbi:MAG: tetratricopeptide repeat protein, partial [Planctomycetota bacterium]
MKIIKRRRLLYFLAMLIIPTILVSCSKRDFGQLSPQDVVNLYFKAREDGDVQVLKRIIYFPVEFSDQEKQEKINSILISSGEKVLRRGIGVKYKPEYEKIIDETTAEVGVVMLMGIPGSKKRIPFQQVILKREKDTWKFYMTTHELTESQLISRIKEDPFDTSSIYLLGRKYQPENPVRASRYFRKYYQLDPDGFWVSDEFLSSINRSMDVQKREEEILADLKSMPKDACDRSTVYRTLGQLYIEQEDFTKAKMYLDKAAESLENSTNKNSP